MTHPLSLCADAAHAQVFPFCQSHILSSWGMSYILLLDLYKWESFGRWKNIMQDQRVIGCRLSIRNCQWIGGCFYLKVQVCLWKCSCVIQDILLSSKTWLLQSALCLSVMAALIMLFFACCCFCESFCGVTEAVDSCYQGQWYNICTDMLACTHEISNWKLGDISVLMKSL